MVDFIGCTRNSNLGYPDPPLMQITHNYKLDEEKIEFEFTKIENI